MASYGLYIIKNISCQHVSFSLSLLTLPCCHARYVPAAIREVVERAKSHDFIIDETEARSLFCNVEEPKPCLYQLLAHIQMAVYSEQVPVVLALRKTREAVDDRQGEECAAIDPEESPQQSTRLDDGRDQDRTGDQGEVASVIEQGSSNGQAADLHSDRAISIILSPVIDGSIRIPEALQPYMGGMEVDLEAAALGMKVHAELSQPKSKKLTVEERYGLVAKELFLNGHHTETTDLLNEILDRA